MYGAAKWHSCAKKWFRSFEIPCEMELWLRNWKFLRFGISQSFRSCKTPCEMGLWLRNWEFLCFAAISQLQNEGHYAAKWHSCAKKWLRSCEILCEMELSLRKWDLSCFGGSQSFRSYEIRVTMLRNGTRVLKLVPQLQNTPRNGALAAKLGIFMLWSFAAVSQLRNGGSCAAK